MNNLLDWHFVGDCVNGVAETKISHGIATVGRQSLTVVFKSVGVFE